MNIDFTNKTVIITGGTGGIGASLVEAFHDTGAKIIFTGTKKVDDITTDIYNNNVNIHYHQLDIQVLLIFH